jgi:hypothetical protein
MLLHGVINDAGPRIAGLLWFALIVVLSIASTVRATRYIFRRAFKRREPISSHGTRCPTRMA